MSNFNDLALAVAQQFAKISNGALFVMSLGTDLYSEYLAAFPEGTNPIYRERTEHDCSACKNFIRNLGAVVSIQNGKIVTVWDGGAGLYGHYGLVAARMAEVVRSGTIQTVFLTQEAAYGGVPNIDPKTGIKHYHFRAEVPTRFVSRAPGVPRSYAEGSAQVLRTALDGITAGAITMVKDLIASNSIYRGEEHKNSVFKFADLHRSYPRGGTEQEKSLFVWENHTNTFARFGNTVIGTLAWDLSEDKDLEASVAAFEKKVAPENYKRPTAIITKRMLEDADKTVRELGLESALERRYATKRDISVTNVLWVDGTVRGSLRDGVSAILADQVAPTKTNIKGEEITYDDFLSRILPQAVSIDLQVEGGHLTNFVSLTAPVHAGPARLFKWQNDFGWSYDGDLADSGIKQRVKLAGGNVNALLRVSLAWFNGDDLDLHCNVTHATKRTVNHIYYCSKQGILDVDMNAGRAHTREPVENLAWDSGELIDGDYSVWVNQFSRRESVDVGFTIEMEFGGQVYQYSYAKGLASGTNVGALNFTIKDGAIRNLVVGAGLTGGVKSGVKWGVHTETLVPVDMVLHSPNHWDGQGVGNRHTFFLLRDCKNPDGTRGIYNEFLRSELDKHRKVFEILGAKTKCPPSDEQLSGLGFSSTRSDVVSVVVKGRRISKAFQIKF